MMDNFPNSWTILKTENGWVISDYMGWQMSDRGQITLPPKNVYSFHSKAQLLNWLQDNIHDAEKSEGEND